MVVVASLLIVYGAALASANPIRRQVAQLDPDSFEEAHQRDDSATRAFSDVQIKTSSGQCLFVDELSGDFRANLTPVQIADCGATDGQGWDIITAGQHNDQPGQMLVVSTLTQACLNFDPRRAAGNQALLFSCGGRADGGGEVTTSQLFAFDGGAELNLVPLNGEGNCLTSAGESLDVATCQDGAADQTFTIGDGAPGNESGNENGIPPIVSSPAEDLETLPVTTPTLPQATSTANDDSNATIQPPTTAAPIGGIPTGNPTTPVPVSRAGGVLDPEAAAEAHQFDATATRAKASVNIRASDGRCLSVDPTAGDFRQNLIPVAMVACADEPGQKFDIITEGVHNNGDAGRALLTSSLTNGCISFDGRRQAGDTVTVFSCGGRAAGEGETDTAQLYPFDGSDTIVLEPLGGNGESCLVAGNDRLDSAACDDGAGQVFEIVEV